MVFAALLLAWGCSAGDEGPTNAAVEDGGPGSAPDGGDPEPAPDGGSARTEDAGGRLEGGSADWDDPLVEPLVWEPCPLFTGAETGDGGTRSEPELDAGPGALVFYNKDAECGRTRMPLFHRRAGGETIPYFVKRLRAEEPRRGQLWLLAGGPGSPGRGLEGLAWLLSEQLPDLDIYLPDHRGTGGSSNVDCPVTKARAFGGVPFESCANEVIGATEHLEAYRTTEASFDVLRLMLATQVGDEPIFIHGGSYGGAWAHRIITIAPDAIAGTVLDGTSPPLGREYVTSMIEGRDAVGRRLLAQCAEQPACADHFDTLDFDVLADRVSALATTCPELTVNILSVRAALTAALESFNLQRLVPAALHHLTGCTPEGMRWFEAFMTEAARRQAFIQPDRSWFSYGLLINVGASETWGAPVGPRALEAAADRTFFGLGAVDGELDALLGWYPTYPADEYTRVWAETTRPVLIVHGDLDPRIDVADALDAAEALSIPAARTIAFPTGGHVVTVASHPYDDRISCGTHVVVQFFQDPSAAIDATCVEETPPMDFDGDRDLVMSLFGTGTAWEPMAL